MNIEYGVIEEARVTDDNGSTVTKTSKLRAGIVNKPVRIRYSIRIKVKDQKQEMEEYIKFSDELKNSPSMFEATWAWETRADNKYVIKSYTILEY